MVREWSECMAQVAFPESQRARKEAQAQRGEDRGRQRGGVKDRIGLIFCLSQGMVMAISVIKR